MFEAFFFASLFLPAVWRAVLVRFFPWAHGTFRLVLFLLPLAVVGVPLCHIGFAAGAYGLFIPLMLGVFWIPQLAFIGFFAWCDREDARQAAKESPRGPGTGGRI